MRLERFATLSLCRRIQATLAVEDSQVLMCISLEPHHRYDELEEWIRARLDKENLTPGKYYPPDEEVKALFLKEKAENEAKAKL